MFDVGAGELILIAVVGVAVIRPKDLPQAMLVAGRFIGKARRMRTAFAAGIDGLVQQSDVRDLEADWEARRAAILADLAARESAVTAASTRPDLSVDQGTIQSPSGEMPPSEAGSSLTT